METNIDQSARFGIIIDRNSDDRQWFEEGKDCEILNRIMMGRASSYLDLSDSR